MERQPQPGQVLRFEPDGTSSWQDPPRKPQNPYVFVRAKVRREVYQQFRDHARLHGYALADMIGEMLLEHYPEWCTCHPASYRPEDE